MKRNLLPFFFLVFATLPAAALEAPLRVADFAPGAEPDPISPESLVTAGGRLYFRGRDAVHGNEPWISDGTAAGTRRLADLCPGPCDNPFPYFVELGGRAYFTSGGRLLLASEQGVTTVAELGGYVSSLVALPPYLYLMVNDGAGGTRPYRSDGTAEGTQPMPEFCGELDCRGELALRAAAGRLYYYYGGALYGLAPAGERQQLATLTAFGASAALGGTLVFEGCTPDGCRLWATGGDAASTRILAPLDGIGNVVAWRGRVYFRNEAGGMSSTDGSAAGTTAEPAFPAGAQPLVASPLALFYQVETGVLSQLLGAVEAGGAHHDLLTFPGGGWFAGRLGNRFFFTFYGEGSAWLAVSDGSTAGTAIVAETGSSTVVGAALNGHLYFGSDEPHDSIFNPTLWRSDGTAAGTVEVVPLRLGGVSSRPRSFSLGQSLVVVTDGPEGKLYRVNPATLEVELVDDRPTSAIAAGRDLFFAAAGQFPERTLVALRESGPSIDLPAAGDGAALDEAGRLYFSGGGPGQQLWRSDGTVAGTVELFDLRPGWTACTGSHHCVEDLPKDITPSGGNVFFVAEVENGDSALWVWPAAGGEPRRLDPPGGFGQVLVAAGGGVLLFDGGGGPDVAAGKIWQTDGTDAGTRPVFSLPLGLSVAAMKLVGQRLFLDAYLPGYYDRWLWAGDLGGAGIVPLAPLAREGGGLAAAGDDLYFGAAAGGWRGSSLAFADGTAAGTRLLRIGAEDSGTGPSSLFALADQRVVFAAARDEAGNELWISDGTAAGTYRLTDLAPGADASSPSDFAQVGGRLFFQADDGVSGRELWALDLPPAGPTCPDDRLCLHGGRYEVFATVWPGPESVAGRRAVGTGESGVFTFFSESNWEVTARLDAPDSAGACAFTAAVASHLPTELTIVDRAGLAETRRFSLLGYGDAPATVFALLPECGADWAGDGYRPALPPAPPTRRCADESDALCLLGGRFRVRAFWRDGSTAGRAWPKIGSSEESGVFALPSPLGGELLVKVLDGCALNGHRWVFAGGSAADAGFTLEITDLATGAVQTYRQEAGAPAIPVQDAAAFACD